MFFKIFFLVCIFSLIFLFSFLLFLIFGVNFYTFICVIVCFFFCFFSCYFLKCFFVKQVPVKIYVFLLFLSLFFSFFIVFAISSRLEISHSLEVRPLLQKNVQSRGCEVWIIDRRNNFSNVIDRENLVLEGEWLSRKRAIVADGRKGTKAYWEGQLNAGVSIAFLTHRYSGLVDVVWDSTSKVYDLYSVEHDELVIHFPRHSNLFLWYAFNVVFFVWLVLPLYATFLYFFHDYNYP